MTEKILVCFHFLLLEYGMYFTFYSEKRFGCLLLAGITFGISLLGGLCKKRFGFLLVGMMSEIIVVLLCKNMAEQIMFTVFIAVMVIVYTIQSASEKRTFFAEISPTWLLFLLLCYIPMEFTGYSGQQALQIFGVSYVILYLLYLSNENMRNFKKLHSRLERLPVVQLGKTFFMSVSGVILWVVFGMFLGRNERLATYLSGRLHAFLERLGSGMIKIAPDGVQGAMPDFVYDYGTIPVKQDNKLPKHSYQVNHALEQIWKVILVVVLMLLLLFLLYSIYCYLKRDRKDDGDMVEFIKKEEEVSSFYRHSSRQRENQKEDSVNAMVRKMYKKKIKSGMKTRIPNWATPYELEIMAQWQEKGSESILHNLYEKARYSKEGCRKEDLDRYKSVEKQYHK